MNQKGQTTRGRRPNSNDCKKHTVSIENEQWAKLERFAADNNVTVSRILNELIRSVSSCESVTSFTIGKEQK